MVGVGLGLRSDKIILSHVLGQFFENDSRPVKHMGPAPLKGWAIQL